MAAIPLAPRTQFLFDMLARLASAGEPTPTNAQMRSEMAAAGFQVHSRTGRTSYSDIVNYELIKLYRAGLVAVIGTQQTRMFEIVTTGERTRIRDKVIRIGVRTGVCTEAMGLATERVREQAVGWPKVTPESAASYDRAVRYQIFARHEMRREATETRVHGAVRGEVERRSFVGCSAAECCA
jgi:hypothetical protein